MRIEILNTGTELLLGSTANTHGTWIGQELVKWGLRVQRQMTVPDGIAIEEALREASHRCDVVIVTGGLGPTRDDLTREVLAEALGTQTAQIQASRIRIAGAPAIRVQVTGNLPLFGLVGPQVLTVEGHAFVEQP